MIEELSLDEQGTLYASIVEARPRVGTLHVTDSRTGGTSGPFKSGMYMPMPILIAL